MFLPAACPRLASTLNFWKVLYDATSRAGMPFNGRIPASGAGYWGSNPCVPAKAPALDRSLCIPRQSWLTWLPPLRRR